MIFVPYEGFFYLHSRVTEIKKDKYGAKRAFFQPIEKSLNNFDKSLDFKNSSFLLFKSHR